MNVFKPKFGLPHPLSKFAVLGGKVAENTFSQEVLEAVNNLELEDTNATQYQSAHWFLMKSETFFRVCKQAGIDGEKFREHLRKVER